MRRVRPLSPATARPRALLPMALRLLVAGVPLVPAAARADVTVPGQQQVRKKLPLVDERRRTAGVKPMPNQVEDTKILRPDPPTPQIVVPPPPPLVVPQPLPQVLVPPPPVVIAPRLGGVPVAPRLKGKK
jgi:hypothetical protein